MSLGTSCSPGKTAFAEVAFRGTPLTVTSVPTRYCAVGAVQPTVGHAALTPQKRLCSTGEELGTSLRHDGAVMLQSRSRYCVEISAPNGSAPTTHCPKA